MTPPVGVAVVFTFTRLLALPLIYVFFFRKMTFYIFQLAVEMFKTHKQTPVLDFCLTNYILFANIGYFFTRHANWPLLARDAFERQSPE